LAVFLLLRATRQPAAIASGIAFAVAIVLQYCAHATFTFGRNLQDRVQATRLAVTVGIGFVLSTVGRIYPQSKARPLFVIDVAKRHPAKDEAWLPAARS
jgi:hypothetical protein